MATEPEPGPAWSLVDGLIGTADRRLWARYCRLAAALEGGRPAPPVAAIGSLEWQRLQHPPTSGEPLLSGEDEAAGRRRLAQRGAPPDFAGGPSPFGAAGAAAFDEFVARRRGSPELAGEADALEQQLVAGFEADGRAGHFRVSGLAEGGSVAVAPEWFGRVRLDFAGSRMVLPDGSAVAGITVLPATPSSDGARRERPARAMLRGALIALWERGAFTSGTGNERVLALALRELGLSAADPPYGFKSAETVRKLRKTLGMSL